MARCQCGREMLTANGCRFKYCEMPPDADSRSKKKQFITRQRVGDEGWIEPGQRCGDCGAKYGYFHHIGCDIERCPVCGGQMISCSCNIPAFTTTKAQ